MTVSTHRRLFLGIPLSGDILNPLDEFRFAHEDFHGIRWVSRIQLHITAYFFGEVQEEMIENLVNLIQLGLRSKKKFELRFDRFCFASPKKEARMIWARYRKHEAFRDMAIGLHELFLQIRPEQQFRKSPIPHITLARLRNFTQHKEVAFPTTHLPSLTVDQLILWESFLRPQGPVYEEMQRFRLG